MKRKLTNEEKKMEQIGLDRNLKELKILEGQLAYNLDMIAKQMYLRDHEDKWRQFLRETTDYENEEAIKQLKSNIKMKEENIKIAEEHLDKGVEIKNHSIN